MPIDFSEREKLLLRELRGNPQFQRILETLSESIPPPPKYKKGGAVSVNEWIYGSGHKSGADLVITILREGK